MSMKFFAFTFLVLVLLVSGPFVQIAEANCKAAADICMQTCNEWFSGDTFWDGIQRAACRTGCGAGYLWCVALE